MNKKHLLGGAALAALVALAAGRADAAALTYDLTCIISSSLSCGQPSYGTVTFADDATHPQKVDVTIDLTGNQEKVQSFYFNYNDAIFGNSTSFIFSGDVTTYSINENQQKADGYSAGKFDIQTPNHGNIGTEPISFIIGRTGVDLDPDDFEFRDTSNKLYNAVHIGNCDVGACSHAARQHLGRRARGAGAGRRSSHRSGAGARRSGSARNRAARHGLRRSATNDRFPGPTPRRGHRALIQLRPNSNRPAGSVSARIKGGPDRSTRSCNRTAVTPSGRKPGCA